MSILANLSDSVQTRGKWASPGHPLTFDLARPKPPVRVGLRVYTLAIRGRAVHRLGPAGCAQAGLRLRFNLMKEGLSMIATLAGCLARVARRVSKATLARPIASRNRVMIE
jgi:hypothetical protein